MPEPKTLYSGITDTNQMFLLSHQSVPKLLMVIVSGNSTHYSTENGWRKKSN